MNKYAPRPIPTDSTQLPTFFNTELTNIANVVNQPFGLPKLTVAPSKPVDGQICYADGTHWNPGSGQGLYYYKTNAWVHIA